LSCDVPGTLVKLAKYISRNGEGFARRQSASETGRFAAWTGHRAFHRIDLGSGAKAFFANVRTLRLAEFAFINQCWERSTFTIEQADRS
jgi:hypothetical protein